MSAIRNSEIRIAGGGPAGLAAALAAIGEGGTARIFEESQAPRHKVCGEFLSPEVAPILDALGVYGRFIDARPAKLTRMKLHFGKREKRCSFSEPGLSLSRYALDQLLWREAEVRGAVMHKERIGAASVIAYGRKSMAERGDRCFGFKAHFDGPTDDAVELFFFPGGYAGVSAIEDGRTNVCGIALESALRRSGFDIDDLLAGIDPLAARVRPLSRRMAWIITGPLVFGSLRQATSVYHAGDALGFIDPFTGSGILNALVTGRLAGIAAVRGVPPMDHYKACRKVMARPFLISAIFRKALQTGWAEYLSALLPARWLFEITRPATMK